MSHSHGKFAHCVGKGDNSRPRHAFSRGAPAQSTALGAAGRQSRSLFGRDEVSRRDGACVKRPVQPGRESRSTTPTTLFLRFVGRVCPPAPPWRIRRAGDPTYVVRLSYYTISMPLAEGCKEFLAAQSFATHRGEQVDFACAKRSLPARQVLWRALRLIYF